MRPIRLHRNAARYFRRMPEVQRARVRASMGELAASDDVAEHRNVKKMRGQWTGCLRLRVGVYRVVFRIANDDEETIDVLLIGPRGDVY